jgi:hypothetical protein
VKKLKDLRNLVNEKHPFLEYTVRYVLEHTDIAEENGVKQCDFVENLHLRTWISLSNLIEKYQICRYTQGASLLYIFANKDLPNLIKAQPTMNTITARECKR